jgi:hypothetical protein
LIVAPEPTVASATAPPQSSSVMPPAGHIAFPHASAWIRTRSDRIGSPEGTQVHSATGMAFRGFRPRMADFILKMPRGAQVVYPKDIGAILVEADIFPGARVLEAGRVGVPAPGPVPGYTGTVVSYDAPEFQAKRPQHQALRQAPGLARAREATSRRRATGDAFDRAILTWSPDCPAAPRGSCTRIVCIPSRSRSSNR